MRILTDIYIQFTIISIIITALFNSDELKKRKRQSSDPETACVFL